MAVSTSGRMNLGVILGLDGCRDNRPEVLVGDPRLGAVEIPVSVKIFLYHQLQCHLLIHI